jgi:outer membrane protein OmpA-like peptidoglycan-associated protein
MWYKSLLFMMFFMGSTWVSQAQQDSTVPYTGPKLIASDCDLAIPVKVFKKTRYGPTVAPNGFGKRQEIVAKTRNSTTAFEKEHNSAWYLLRMYFDGEIIFDIKPADSSNDYDFILYRYTDSTFCDALLHHKVAVVRSNIRRNDTNTKGVTGLSREAENELQAQGPGAQYSRSLSVKKGDKYMLALDNVYPDGKGHTLFFHYIRDVMISGSVISDEGKKLQAEVELSDTKGNTILKSKADDSGRYSFRTPLRELEDYQLTFMDNNSFVETRTINTSQLKDTDTFPKIRTVLQKLKKGKKYTLGNINFYGGSSVLLPASYPSVHALYKLMKKNATLQIQIEGHVNAPFGNPEAEQHQKLSEWRAKTVYDYLADHGIDTMRISMIGLSSRFMLFPTATSEAEQAKNRRVEINIVSLGANRE